MVESVQTADSTIFFCIIPAGDPGIGPRAGGKKRGSKYKPSVTASP